MTIPANKSRCILGMRVDATTYREAAERVLAWVMAGSTGYVCAANVHMVMESYDSPDFRRIVNGAGLVTPDGMPLVWALRLMGCQGQQRVYGPNLMLEVCERAAERGVPIGLYGGQPEALSLLQVGLLERFPQLEIRFAESPPFRPPTEREEDEVACRVNQSGARILLVALGCPKQERWMATQQGRITSIMLGVGAAFDFHSGQVRQSPSWIQRIGMEWFFRLLMEPRRLWKRYLKHNPRFLVFFILQLSGLLHMREAKR